MLKTLTEEIAVRSKSIDYFAIGSMYLPNPDPVLKAQGKDIQVYNDLRIDDRVSGSMTNRFNASLSLDWQIDKGKTSKNRQAKAIQAVFDRLPLNRIMGEILQARSFGYAPLEIIWGQSDGLTIPLDVVLKPQRWFVFGPDNDLRFRSRENMMVGDELPPRKFLCPVNEASYEDPYGLGLLSRCFWPVVFKKGGWRFWVQFSEKYGQIWPLGKLPRGATEKEQKDMLALLVSMVQDGAAVIPDDGSIEFKESATKGATSDLYRGIIAEANSAISTVWLGHAGAGESVAGDMGGKDVSSEVRTDLRDADKSLIEETLNQLVNWICEINWGAASGNPSFSLWEEEEVDQAQADRDKALSESMARSGLKLTRDYYLREYNLEDGDIDIVAVVPPVAPVNTVPAIPGLPAQFSAPVATFPDQLALDSAAGAVPPEVMQAWMDPPLKPVIVLIQSGGSYDQVLEKLSGIYPEMNSDLLIEMLTRAFFVADVWGKLNVRS